LGTFQSTNRQALEAIKKLQKDGKIKSVGTNRNYLEALKHIAKHTTGNLRDLTKENPKIEPPNPKNTNQNLRLRLLMTKSY
jgi:hypothetical protein